MIAALPARSSAGADSLSWLARHGVDACDLDDPSEVERAFRTLSAAQKRSSAGLATFAALNHRNGDMATALALFRRAAALCKDSQLFAAISEREIAMLLSSRTFEDAAEPLERALSRFPSELRFIAQRADLRARRGDFAASLADLRTVDAGSVDDLLLASRTFNHGASAAYYLKEPDLTERLALRSAEAAMQAGSNRRAGLAHLLLYNYYYSFVGDFSLARFYASQSALEAAKGRHDGLRYIALVAEYELTGETGDLLRLDDLREQIAPLRRSEMFQERLSLVIADAFDCGLRGRFESMRGHLGGIELGALHEAERSIHSALLAIASLGVGEDVAALRCARRAITFGRPKPSDAAYLRRYRGLARVLGAAILARCGQSTKARRARDHGADGATGSIRILESALCGTISNETVQIEAPDVYGYVALFAALAPTQEDRQLTKRQQEILQRRAQGQSVLGVATSLGLSVHTIRNHQRDAITELGVHGIIAAIAEARRRKLIV